ncbi:MAG: S26 family signal peptidase [Halomonadaceae bacterium]|nr:S26 family signal peptidase [Halomonadaceae bacterium]
MEIAAKREPWSRFAFKALVVGCAIIASFMWLESRFRIGIDGQAIRCLPDHKYYLVDMARIVTDRDAIVAYRSEGLDPYFEDGTMMAKIIKGKPGDHLVVDAEGVQINGEVVATGFALSERLGVDHSELYKNESIPAGHYLLLAPAPESFDGRYWGYVKEEQLIGKVIPLI